MKTGAPVTATAQYKRDLIAGAGLGLLTKIHRGLEKEGLRVDSASGMLAQTPHPKAIGSALTHPSITTDYSESLLEFITPVSDRIETSLEQLSAIHRFTSSQLGDELIWGASMPCIVSGDSGIPIANYGSSNVGVMKRVYRNGLGVRYGRMMQAIAGIHYNFSMPDAFWQQGWEQAGKPGTLQDYQNDGYLGLIRNFSERVWLLIYLLGASPAVCASFLAGRKDHPLVPFDETGTSLHLPYATSLRMGDLGYNSSAQSSLQVCYNQLDTYIQTLHQAIVTPHPAYSHFKVTDDGEMAQLNDSLLQIENEFYSPIRPKRVTRSGEAPLVALQRAGIEYIEVRCLDINPFLPLGIDAETIRLVDTFLLDALLSESPQCGPEDMARNKENIRRVVESGRDPQLKLLTRKGERSLKEVAGALLDQMAQTASLLDDAHRQQGRNSEEAYSAALGMARTRIADPELTPSGRILREMRDDNMAFWQLALKYSRQWQQGFREDRLCDAAIAEFETASQLSLHRLATLEADNSESFETYLARFFDQYHGVKL